MSSLRFGPAAKKLVALLSIWAVVLPALGSDNADNEVYTDFPCGSWQDWSWATRDMGATTYHRSAQRSIKVDMGPWTALYFQNVDGGLRTDNFQFLDFWVNGGTSSGQKFAIKVRVNGVDQAQVISDQYATVKAGTWTLFHIPLLDLHAAKSNVTGVFFAESTGQTVPTFYMDDIRFVRALPTGPTAITVDASQKLYSLSQTSFGVNVAVWDGLFSSQSTKDKLLEAGFGILRYPGGSLSDTYHWKTHKTDDGTLWSWGPDTKAFLNMATSVGALKLMTLNYGSGTPAEAAEWMAYAKAQGGNVRHWCVGNECFGFWENDLHPKKQDAPTYAQFVADLRPLAAAADAGAFIGVVGTCSESDFEQTTSVVNPRTGQTVKGWSPVLMKSLHDLGVLPDFYEVHYYPTPNGAECDSHMLQTGTKWTQLLKNARQMLMDYFGPQGAKVPIFVTENNGGGTGKQMTSLVNGLYLADSLLAARVAGASVYCWWDLRNGTDTSGNMSTTLYGWRNWGDFGLLSAGKSGTVGDPADTPYPSFYAFKLLKQFCRRNDSLISVSGTHPLIRAYASLSPNGTVRLLLINQAKALDLDTTITLNGASMASSMTMLRYGVAEDKGRLDLATSSVAASGGTLSLKLPRYSMSVVVLKP